MSSEIISLDASAHPVKAVTIFQSSIAQVTRTFNVDLKSGNNVLEISGISSNVDEDSVQIYGLGKNARVVDISSKASRSSSNSWRLCSDTWGVSSCRNQSKHATFIRIREEEHRVLKAERQVLEAEWDALSLTAMAEKSDRSASFDELMAKFVTSKRNTMKAIVETEKKIEEIQGKIRLFEGLEHGETCAVVVIVRAKVDYKLEFQLTYLVTGVTWKPYYDLHGATVDGRPSLDISLHYCANITQNSGEDWNDTILTLSTANSQGRDNFTTPKVDPIHVLPPVLPEVRKYRVPSPQTKRRANYSTPLCYDPPSMALFVTTTDDAWGNGSSTEEMATNSIILDKNPFSLVYRVDPRISLPSERSTHKMSIAVLNFSGALKYVCVPQKTNAVFMEAQIQNASPYELLAGEVNVFIDDSFTTKTEMEHIGLNETFTCMLGIDPSLKVSYQSEFRTVHEPKRNFTEPSKTTTRTVTTTITNGHSFDIIELVVRDAIPLGDDDTDVKVALRRPEGLAEAKADEEVTVALHGSGEAENSGKPEAARVRWAPMENGSGGEKDGLYEWVCQIKAGNKIRLEAEWEVKAPSYVQWEER